MEQSKGRGACPRRAMHRMCGVHNDNVVRRYCHHSGATAATSASSVAAAASQATRPTATGASIVASAAPKGAPPATAAWSLAGDGGGGGGDGGGWPATRVHMYRPSPATGGNHDRAPGDRGSPPRRALGHRFHSAPGSEKRAVNEKGVQGGVTDTQGAGTAASRFRSVFWLWRAGGTPPAH